MPEINLYNGGINRFKDPRKLSPNEFVSVVNCDVSSGSVRALPIPTQVNSGIGSVFTEYRNELVSGSGEYLKFESAQQYLVKSDGNVPMYTSGNVDSNGNLDWTPMGVEVTSGNLSVDNLKITMTISVTGEVGSSEVGTYSYMIQVNDDKIYSFDWKCPTAGRQVTIYPNTIFLPWNTIKIYRRYQGSYYLLSTGETVTDFVIDPSRTKFPQYNATSTYIFPAGYGIPYPAGFYTGIQCITDGRTSCRLFHTDSTSGPSVYVNRLEKEFIADINFATGQISGMEDLPATGINSDRYLRYDGNFAVGQMVTIGGKELVNDLWEFIVDVNYDFGGAVFFRGLVLRIAFNSIKVVHVSPPPVSSTVFFLPAVPDLIVREPLSRIFEVEASSDGTITDGSSKTLQLDKVMDRSLQGAFQYCITYEDELGQETKGEVYSNTIVNNGSSMVVSIGNPVSAPPEVTKVNLYRVNSGTYSGQTRFLFVEQFDIDVLPTSYIDSKTISELGRILPDATLTSVQQDMLFFTSYKGRLFGATKDTSSTEPLYTQYNTLRWSNIGRPLTWDGLSFLNMDKYITGLGTTANGLIILGRTTTHSLQGTDSEFFSLRLLSSSHGCVDHRSIQHWKGNCVYAGVEGINITDGGDVNSISYPKLGLMAMDNETKEIGSVNSTLVQGSAVIGNSYFLLYKTGVMLKIELDTFIITELTYDKVFKGINQINGSLQGVTDDGTLYQLQFKTNYSLGSTANSWYSLTSGVITEGAITNLKEYDKVRVSSSGRGSITIKIDGQIVALSIPLNENDDKLAKSSVTTIGIPNEYNKGYGIEFIISGTGALHSIEYSLKGRENG